MKQKKNCWKKPQLIVLSRETSEEFSAQATCKNAVQTTVTGGLAGKTGCQKLGCNKSNAPS